MDTQDNGVVTPPAGNEGQAPSKIVINGQEYDPTEAQALIDTGRKTREYEKQWNTSLDKVWPDYGKLATEKKQLEEKLAAFETKKDAGTETPADIRQAQEAARKLGLILNEDLDKAGYIKRADLDSYLESREKEKEAIQNVLKQADKLATEIDGKDGRPKFVKKHVLAYANAYKIADLQKAYDDMYSEELKGWRDAQINAKKSPGLKTLKGSNQAKAPAAPKLTDDNVGAALREALYGGNAD